MRTREKKPVERARWFKRDGKRSRHCFVGEMAFWNEDLEKAEWTRKEMSSPALRGPKMKAIEKMQRRIFSERGREARSGEEHEERDEKGLAQLTTLMPSSVPKARAHWSCLWGSW